MKGWAGARAVGVQRPPAAALLIINGKTNPAERCLTQEQPGGITLPSPFTHGPNSPPGCAAAAPVSPGSAPFTLTWGAKSIGQGTKLGCGMGWVPPTCPCPPGMSLGQPCPHGGPHAAVPAQARLVPVLSGAAGDAHTAGTGLDRVPPGPSWCLAPPSLAFSTQGQQLHQGYGKAKWAGYKKNQ